MELLLEKLGVNWQLLLAQAVNFLVLVGVLGAFVYKPLLKLIDERAERVRKAMEGAKRTEEEIKNLEQQRTKRLSEIDEEAGKLFANAKVQAEQLQKELMAKAQREAEQMLERGRLALAEERAEALAAIQDAAARVIVQLTETLLRREFTEKDQQKMLKEMTEKLPAMLS